MGDNLPKVSQQKDLWEWRFKIFDVSRFQTCEADSGPVKNKIKDLCSLSRLCGLSSRIVAPNTQTSGRQDTVLSYLLCFHEMVRHIVPCVL